MNRSCVAGRTPSLSPPRSVSMWYYLPMRGYPVGFSLVRGNSASLSVRLTQLSGRALGLQPWEPGFESRSWRGSIVNMSLSYLSQLKYKQKQPSLWDGTFIQTCSWCIMRRWINIWSGKIIESLRCKRYAKMVCCYRWLNLTNLRREVKKFQRNGQRNPSRNGENPVAIMIKMRSSSRFRTVAVVTTA